MENECNKFGVSRVRMYFHSNFAACRLFYTLLQKKILNAADYSTAQPKDDFTVKKRNEILRYVALGSLLLACGHNSLYAQTELQNGSSSNAQTSEQPTEVLEKLPPFVLLPDQEGKPSVPFVPTFPLDELNKYLQQARPRDNPHYVIKSMKLDVVAKANHAVVQNEITFSVEKGGTSLIPIQMGSVHLSSPRSKTKQETEEQTERRNTEKSVPAVRGIRRNNEFGEWELIVNADKNTEHTVIFESQVRLKRLGNETHLRLQLPRVTDSEMTIRVPLADANARLLSDGMLSQPIEPNVAKGSDQPTDETNDEASDETNDEASDETNDEASDETGDEDQGDEGPNQTEQNNSTEFVIDGLPSEFDFVWYPKSEPPSGDQLSFEVEGDIGVEVDSLGGLTADALLTVTSFNKPIEGLIVTLPAGTRLTDNDMAGFGDYEVQTLEADPASARRQVRVTFAEAALKPASVGLKVKAEQEMSKFELAGFEVLVADGDKQIQPTSESGGVTVVSQGTRRLEVKPGDFARRISGEADATRNTSAFEYSRTNQIQLLISRQSTELAVEPTYIVEIEESRATLTAIFQCQKRGGNLNSLSFNLGEWNSFLEIYRDPDGVVGDVYDDETLEIQLEDAPDSFEISFQARKQFVDSLDTNARELLFNFPVPIEAQQIRQAKIGIVTADSIGAEPQSMQAYTKSTPTDLMQTFASELGSNVPQGFLMKAMKAPADISVTAKRLQARVKVNGDIEITELEVDGRAIRVRVKETLRWQVRNVALPAAILRMRKSIYESADGDANLQVSIDGVSRLSQDLERKTNYFPSNMVSIRVGLAPQLGAFEMELNYDWLYEDPQPISEQRPRTIELPLVLPQSQSKQSEMEIDLRLMSPRTANYSVTLAQSPDTEPWLASADSELVQIDPDVEAFLPQNTSTAPTTIPLEVRPVERRSAEAEFDELVDRAWFQTWLTDSRRRDRAVFRVKGGGRDGIRIEMPRSNIQNLYAMVDGVPTTVSTRDGEMIEIAVDASNETRVVELLYWHDKREPPGLLANEVPSVVGADILGQWYWHIVMPKNECMVTWPRSLTRAHHWDWSVIVPARRPQLSLEELEEWSGATIIGDRVLAGSTEYLFGAMGETKGLSIRTTTLPMYVIILAGSVFLLGLVLLYYRRRVITLVAVGALIGALIFLHPSYASIAGQVAVFGMLLVLFMTFLRWLANQTAVRRAATSAHDSGFDLAPVSRVDSGSSAVVTTSTTLAAGSSRITQP